MPNFVIDQGVTTPRTLASGEIGAVLATGAVVHAGTAVGMTGGTLSVSGMILATAAAAQAEGDARVTVAEGGSMVGQFAVLQSGTTAGNLTVVNDGLMQGDADALLLDNQATFKLTNSGLIQGTGFNAVNVTASSFSQIVNTGEIVGNENGILLDGPGTVLITNHGIINAADNAIFALGTGAIRVQNLGTLAGTVNLSGNADTFDGRNGVQLGQVQGDGGNDTLLGGDAGDDLGGGAGNDQLRGNAGADRLVGDAGNDTMRGGDGDDTMEGGIGDDQVRGEAGNDDLIGGDGNDNLGGGDGNDYLEGGNGADSVAGGEGDDELVGGGGSDRLAGGRGDDLLAGGLAADVFEFGRANGSDVVSDFQNGSDRLDLRAFHFASAAEVIGLASTTSTGLSIDLSSRGGGEILISAGLTLAQLDAGDLIL